MQSTPINPNLANAAPGSFLVFSGGEWTYTAGTGATGAAGLTDPIFIGTGAGDGNGSSQQPGGIAIGVDSGQSSQAANAIAIGTQAGTVDQHANSVAVGLRAANSGQRTNSVAIGPNSGSVDQQTNAIAIGNSAGFSSQGAGCIAIGSAAGLTNQPQDSIVINASSIATPLNPAFASSLYINPIRAATGINNVVYYDPSSAEVTYSSITGAHSALVSNVAVSNYFAATGSNTGVTFTGTVITSSSGLSDRGVVWSTTNPPTAGTKQPFLGAGAGTFTSIFNTDVGDITVYAQTYAVINGISYYGAILNAVPQLCLVVGTMILLANGMTKKIEDITYADDLLVWNFDTGQYDKAKPLWISTIRKSERYNRLEFSNGTILKTVGDHRIYDKSTQTFAPAMESVHTGSETFATNTDTPVYLTSKSIIEEPVEYCNIITDRHINLFAESILTSCRYNNIYPVDDMKFVKDQSRETIEYSTYELFNIPREYYDGMRLGESLIPIADTAKYVQNLIDTKAEFAT
jgi:hypothetical protein